MDLQEQDYLFSQPPRETEGSNIRFLKGKKASLVLQDIFKMGFYLVFIEKHSSFSKEKYRLREMMNTTIQNANFRRI